MDNYLEAKSKELQLLELSLRNQEFFYSMKQLQLSTKEMKNLFKTPLIIIEKLKETSQSSLLLTDFQQS